MRDGFSDQRNDREPHLTSGRLLNRQARIANRESLSIPSGHQQLAMIGHHRASIQHPPTIVTVGVIVNADNDCDPGEFDESEKAPCKQEELYLCRERYYDYDKERWEEYEEDQALDASWAHDLSSVNSVDMPAFPPLAKGDLVSMYWDELRGHYVPLFKPLPWLIAKTGSGGIPAGTGNGPGKATVTILAIDDNDRYVTHVDKDGNDVTRTCYNLATSGAVAANTVIQMSQELITGKFVAVWEDC